MKALSNTDVTVCKALLNLRGNEHFKQVVDWWRKCEQEAVIAAAAQKSDSRDWYAGRLSVFIEIIAAVNEANGKTPNFHGGI